MDSTNRGGGVDAALYLFMGVLFMGGLSCRYQRINRSLKESYFTNLTLIAWYWLPLWLLSLFSMCLSNCTQLVSPTGS